MKLMTMYTIFNVKIIVSDWKIDYASYDWKKLDSDAEETKALVEQYFKWEGTDKEGRKFNQGKIFK